MGYIIDLCGELTEVTSSFFSQNFTRHDIIGDTHFISVNELTFSIHNNIWERVQIDLRNSKINSILK